MLRRQRNLILTAVLAVGAALAMFLKGLFPTVGGPGDSEGDGPPDLSAVRVDVAPVETVEPQPEESASQPPIQGGLVDLLIDGRTFYAAVAGETSRQERSLEAVVAAVRQAEPNAEGVRVRITRTKDSLPSAEKAIKDGLEAAGVRETEINWVAELVAVPDE